MKIQKMNELEELRRVVKDLNRRLDEKKKELVIFFLIFKRKKGKR